MASLEKRKQMIAESQSTSNKRRKDWEEKFDSLRNDYLLETERADSAAKDCLEYIKALEQSRFYKEFEVDQEEDPLGRGAYGKVYRSKHKLDGKYYAIKRIKYLGSNAILLPEVHALSTLKHEAIVQYHTSWVEDDIIDPEKTLEAVPFGEQVSDSEDDASERVVYFDLRTIQDEQLLPRSLYIQMELCEGSLYNKILDGKVNYQRGTELFTQIVEAVAYIHGQHIVHKDLSSSNIFVDESTSRVKIGDFGIAKVGLIDLHPSSPGNEHYKAPERSNEAIYIDAKVDIFSLGKLLLELLSNISSASERFTIFTNFSEKKGFILPSFLKEDDKAFILKLTSEDPKDRPSAEEVLFMWKHRSA